jgi:hypothetical protein
VGDEFLNGGVIRLAQEVSLSLADAGIAGQVFLGVAQNG